MTNIIKSETAATIVPINDSAALMGAIASAAANPQVDADKMERLLAMYEKVEARRAEAAYANDFAEMQTELPAITERGNAAGRYTYALWEDINTAIKPVLARHGFALSFRTDFTDGIAVIGVLAHRGGHKEVTCIKLPADPSGNKNAVQAVASAVSYGKRYTAGALLNLTSHGEDDDAYAASSHEDPVNTQGWFDAIAGATSMEELNKLADELRDAGLTGAPLRNVRAKWAARAKELKA